MTRTEDVIVKSHAEVVRKEGVLFILQGLVKLVLQKHFVASVTQKRGVDPQRECFVLLCRALMHEINAHLSKTKIVDKERQE